MNVLVSQITNDLSTQNVNHIVTTSINPNKRAKTIINDPNLNQVLAPIQPIIKLFI